MSQTISRDAHHGQIGHIFVVHHAKGRPRDALYKALGDVEGEFPKSMEQSCSSPSSRTVAQSVTRRLAGCEVVGSKHEVSIDQHRLSTATTRWMHLGCVGDRTVLIRYYDLLRLTTAVSERILEPLRRDQRYLRALLGCRREDFQSEPRLRSALPNLSIVIFSGLMTLSWPQGLLATFKPCLKNLRRLVATSKLR